MEQIQSRQSQVTWGAISAVGCFVSGILAGVLGSVLTAGAWIWGSEPHPVLRGIGTALLILTIPLLIGAGHCLDLMEREQNKQRREFNGQPKR